MNTVAAVITAVEDNNGLNLESLLATVGYTALGIIILVVAVMAINAVFGLNVRKELVNDNNTAVGIVIAGLALSIAIIIAGTISS